MASNGTLSDADGERALTIERLLAGPMPWIGGYVAGASLLCALAMAADALHGFWKRNHWFPSNFFSLNATSLTLLGVAMKLPVDLTTRMYNVTDRLAKISSLAFMTTAMANFLTSLGSMGNKDIISNVTALGILVITVIGNVLVQVIELRSFLRGRLAFPEEMLVLGAMFLMLVMFTSSAVMVPSTKRYLETKYHEMHRSALIEEQADVERLSTDKLRVLIKKYWVMAETSNPQFVIARSVTSTTAGALSLLSALVLLEAEIRMSIRFSILKQTNSSYGKSTKCVMLFQTIGVMVGTIAPAFRWFTAMRWRYLNESRNNLKSAVTVEEYWTQKMVDWRQSSLSFHIRHLESRKFLYHLRGMFLKFCISVQYLIVLASKLLLLISIYITSPAISLLNYLKRLKRQIRISKSVSSRDQEVSESTVNSELDLKRYVMLLDGEAELPTETLEIICKDIDKVINKGKLKKPKELLNLLSRSCDFRGVIEFDSHQVPNLHSQDLPYCWSLPVVTLSCIALALPNIETNKSASLLNSVAEGLCFVKIIDETLDKKGVLVNIRNAADFVWVKVEMYHKWQDKDLRETSLKGENSREILRELCDKAEKTVLEFEREARSCLVRNPLNWPANVIAANSMYRVSRTILLNHGAECDKTDEELFEQLSTMIADILAACLTNLAHVITKKCRHNAIEEREKSVRKAALLLGETEEILALLQQRELPIFPPGQAASIERWRTSMKQEA